jgi:tetratricopeptide (TPR) repeat protein
MIQTMRTTVLLLAFLLGPACSIKNITINTTASLMKEGGRAMEKESDLDVARAAAPGQIKSVEGILESAPTHRVLLEISARACLEYAFGFLEDDVESLTAAKDAGARQAQSARATQMYDRGFAYALRLLETYDAGIRAALERGGTAWETAVGKLPADAVPGLTFGGMALASAIGLNRSDPARLADLPKAKVLLERSRALDPRFNHGGASMTLGIIHAQLGDRDASRRYFVEAIDAAGEGYLLPRVAMAKFLLTQPKDRKERQALLEAVLSGARDASPENRLANEVARRRAARYLEPRD